MYVWDKGRTPKKRTVIMKTSAVRTIGVLENVAVSGLDVSRC